MRSRRTQATHPSPQRTGGLRRLAAAALALPLALGTLAATALPASADEDPATISHSQEAVVGVLSTASFTCVDRADQPVASALWQASGQPSQRVTNPTPGGGYLTFSRDVTFDASGLELLFLTCEYAEVAGTTPPSTSTNVFVHVRYETVPTGTVVSFSPERVEPGGDVTVSAKVTTASGPVTEGTVNFSIGALELGGRDVGADGVATLTIPGLAPGAHTVEAAYYGTEILEASVSDATVWVKTATTVTTVIPDLVRAPHTVLRASAVPVPGFPAPTGTMTFRYSEGATLGTATIVAGEAVLQLPDLAPGVYEDVVAVYSGDGSYGSATSGRTTMSVNPALVVPPVDPTVTVPVAVTTTVATPATITVGFPTSPRPTTVTVTEGGTVLLEIPVPETGDLTVVLPVLSPGTHDLVVHTGATQAVDATANPVRVTVAGEPATVSPTPDADLTGSTTELTAGQQITLVARDFEPFESVAFYLHSDPVFLGVAEADAEGTARLTVALPAGTPDGLHHVRATGGTSGRWAEIPVTVTSGVEVATPPVVLPVVTEPVAVGVLPTDPAVAPRVVTAAPAAASPAAVPSVPLASTGAQTAPAALLVAVLLGSGTALVVGRRRFGALAA